MILLSFQTPSVLWLFGPFPGLGLLFLQALLYLAAARKFFCVKKFCLQITRLKFSSCSNFKILFTAIYSHPVTLRLSKIEQGSKPVYSTFHWPVHPRNFIFHLCESEHLLYTES
jgi:hypothetical protein